MATKHWVFVSELGDNFGHVVSLLQVAKLAAERGASISFIVPSLLQFHTMSTIDYDFNLYQGPINVFQKVKSNAPPQTYAESLLLHGYSQPKALAVAIKVWRSIFSSLQPDIVLFDYAPTALLAAREYTFKKIMLGSGYCVPPVHCAKLPLLGRQPSLARMETSEHHVFAAVNAALNDNKMMPLSQLDDLGRCDARFIKTIPALDCYRDQRTVETYSGLCSMSGKGNPAVWPKATGKIKVFAYLSTQFPFTPVLIQWLQSHFMGHIFVTGKNTQQCTALSTDTLSVTAKPYNMDTVMAGCDFVICHAGSGTVSSSLLAAKPLVCIPLQGEQQLTAERIEGMGLGVFIRPAKAWEQLLPAIKTATVQLPVLQRNAITFLQSYYDEYGTEDPTLALLQRCENLLSR